MGTFACVWLCRELKAGIPVTNDKGNRLGESVIAAQQAISQVIISRILMAAPGMGQWNSVPLSLPSPRKQRLGPPSCPSTSQAVQNPPLRDSGLRWRLQKINK